MVLAILRPHLTNGSNILIVSLISQLISCLALLFDKLGALCHRAALPARIRRDPKEILAATLEPVAELFPLLPLFTLYSLLLERLADLLPTTAWHNYQLNFHLNLLRRLANPAPYFTAFFSVIHTQFDSLFLPSPPARSSGIGDSRLQRSRYARRSADDSAGHSHIWR
jgi:hypothetical protein